MSLITRCPACGTMFKVVPDQLRISEGWVRCGHCAEVFDARAHLQTADALATAPGPLPVPDGGEPVPDVADAGGVSEAFNSSLITEIDEGLPSQAPDSLQLEAQAQALREDPLDRPFELRREDVAARDEPAAELPRRFLPPQHDSEPEFHDLSFVREARRKAFWSRPFTRALLGVSVLALGLLLALQLAVHDRDRLAAAEPGLRPWLGMLCERIGCLVRPPRQIDAIAIDSSSFNKLRGDAYRLNVTLKNEAATAVAMPALELTLTDGQDQPVLRRVLMPAELGMNAGIIGAASEWTGSLAFAVAGNGNGSRIAGYRLLAFYP